FFIFFSGRRRHTRFSVDWSSDVCSSDLPGSGSSGGGSGGERGSGGGNGSGEGGGGIGAIDPGQIGEILEGMRRARERANNPPPRSEERRVGKVCRSWRTAHC